MPLIMEMIWNMTLKEFLSQVQRMIIILFSSGYSQEIEIDTMINEKQTDPIEESKKNHRQIRAKKSRSFFEYVPQPKGFSKCL